MTVLQTTIAQVQTLPLDGSLLIKLLALSLVLGQVISIWLGLSNRTNIQRREVSFGFVPASKEEFDKHAEHAARIHSILFDRIDQMGGLHTEELKLVRERISGVETEARLTNQRIAQVDSKLDRLIERR